MKTLLLTLLLVPMMSFGQNNYSMSLDGSDDWVSINDNDMWALESNDFTISADINIDNISNPSQPSSHVGIIQQFQNNATKWQIYLYNNEIYFGIKLNGVWNEVSVPWTPQLNTWKNISCARESNVINFYVDGQNIGSISSTINIPNISGSLNLGKYEWDTDFTGLDGSLDNIEIWNIALTEQEIQQYMNCSPTGTESGLVGYWNFEEGSGTTAYDLTSNGNDGIINGATYSTDVPVQICCTTDTSYTDVTTCDSTYLWNNSTYTQSGTYSYYGESVPVNISGLTYGGEFNGSNYYISNDTMEWESGNSLANSLGGTLAIINSQSELQYITDNLGSLFTPENQTNGAQSGAWIGFNNGQWLNGEIGVSDFCVHYEEENNNTSPYGMINIDDISFSGGASASCIGNESASWYNVVSIIEIPFSLSTINGCDSVAVLNLTLNNPSSSIDVITACDSYMWVDGNTYIASNNTATWTETNTAGCDSVVTLDLTINYSTIGTDVITACDSYTWGDGNTYTASNNTATQTFTNAAGCDSIVTLDLTINYSNTETDVIAACDSYTWGDGNTYTASNNTATQTFENAAGCDSVVTLDLTINYSNTGTDVITACDSYEWVNGITYTSSNNTATYTATNTAGCDSVVTLDLTIKYSSAGIDTHIACDSYIWVDGITYTSSNNTAQWVYANAIGCDSIVTLNLTVNPNPNLQASNNQNICEGTAIALNATGAETYTWSNGVQNTQVFIPDTSATYYVTGSNNYGCSSIDSTLVTVNSNPILNTSGPQEVCSGATVTLSASGASSYDWSGAIINNQPFTVYTSNVYQVTGFDQNSCSSTAQVTITVNETPISNAGNDNIITCTSNQNGVSIGAPPNSSVNYNWSPPTGLSSSNSSLTDANPSSTTIYTLTSTNNSNGCTSSDYVTVFVDNQPPISSAGNDNTITCTSNQNGVSIGAPPNSSVNYNWSPPAGLSSSNSSLTDANPSSTTIYTLTSTNNSNGCTSSDDVTVFVDNQLPISNAGLDKTISCLINQNGATIGSSPNSLINYSWSPLVGLSSPNTSLTNANPTTTTSYTLTSTDQTNGCSSYDNLTVFVDNSEPIAFAGNDNTINCSSNINGLEIGIPPSSNTSYSWTPQIGLNNSNISSPLAIPDNSTTYVLLVTNDINGCSSTDDIIITVDNNIPIVNAGDDISICAGESLALNGSGQGNVSWSPSFNLSSATVLDPLSNPNTSTLYTLSITALNGCQNSDEIMITVNQIPEIDLGSNISICQGDSVEMNISTSGNQITWTGMGINETGNNIIFLPNTSDYLVATISDSLGCSDSDSIFITVIDVETPEIIGNSIVCGNSFWEEYSTTSNFNSLDWIIDNGTIMGSTNPYNILVHWNQQDSGIVYLEAMSNDNGCFTQNELIVDFSGLAPDTTIIDHISNSNVLYAQQSFPIMRWGYTNTINNSSIYTCENSQYCNFINFDPLFYTYWLETGENFNCLTKTYYNKPEYYLSLNNEENNKDIFIYPNPTEGLISIQSSYLSSVSTLELVDASGKGGLYFKIQGGITKIDISNLESGIYYLKSESLETPIKIVKI